MWYGHQLFENFLYHNLMNKVVMCVDDSNLYSLINISIHFQWYTDQDILVGHRVSQVFYNCYMFGKKTCEPEVCTIDYLTM